MPSSTDSVHDLDLGDAQFGNLLDDRLGQRLKRARHDETFFLVGRVMDQNAVRQIFKLLGFLDREFLDVVKQLEDFLVRAAGFLAIVLALHVDGAFNIQKDSARNSVEVKNFRRRFLRSR